MIFFIHYHQRGDTTQKFWKHFTKKSHGILSVQISLFCPGPVPACSTPMRANP